MYGKGEAIQSWNSDQTKETDAKIQPAHARKLRAPVSTVATISSSFSCKSCVSETVAFFSESVIVEFMKKKS